MEMSFDELIKMKGLQFKASLAGRDNGVMRLLEGKEGALEALGMKNMCFRVHPWDQARLEVLIEALGMSKQEALSEMLVEMIHRIEAQLDQIGVGQLDYHGRLRALGYEMSEPNEQGMRRFLRVEEGQG
jgi:hypothetical protein